MCLQANCDTKMRAHSNCYPKICYHLSPFAVYWFSCFEKYDVHEALYVHTHTHTMDARQW